MGLAADDETPEFIALAGGVSSDIWRVELARGPICVKRALAQLKVAAEWHAPVERNACEVGWIEGCLHLLYLVEEVHWVTGGLVLLGGGIICLMQF